jgi:WD40 repeat protein
LAVSPDGHYLASGGQDRTIKIWDLFREGGEVRTLPGHVGSIRSLAFGRRGQRLASSSDDGYVIVWEVSTPEEFKFEGATIAAFSSDSALIATGTKNGVVKVWDVESRRQLHELAIGAGDISFLKFSPGGDRLAVARGAAVGVWDIMLNKEIANYQGHVGQVIVFLDFSPDGTKIVSAASPKSVIPAKEFVGIRVWDVSTGDEIVALPGSTTARFRSDGKQVTGIGPGGMLTTWDAATGAEVSQTLVPGLGDFPIATISDDGRLLVWSTRTRMAIHVYDSVAKTSPRTLKGHTHYIQRAVASPDGKRILSTAFDRTMRLWDVSDGQEILRWDRSFGQLTQFSPDGQWLSVGTGKDVYLMNATRPPKAEVIGPALGRAGETLAFDGSKSRSGTSQALQFHWDFGDGATAKEPKVEHGFAHSGRHRVQLTVTKGKWSDSVTLDIVVLNDSQATEGASDQWSFAEEPNLKITFQDDEGVTIAGRSSIAALVDPYHGKYATLAYPKTRDAGWSLAGKSHLAFWLKTENPNAHGWQNVNPVVGLYQSETEFIRFAPASDLLKQREAERPGDWVSFAIPLTGDEQWQRAAAGGVGTVNWITISLDSWGHDPFRVWIDGLALE